MNFYTGPEMTEKEFWAMVQVDLAFYWLFDPPELAPTMDGLNA